MGAWLLVNLALHLSLWHCTDGKKGESMKRNVSKKRKMEEKHGRWKEGTLSVFSGYPSDSTKQSEPGVYFLSLGLFFGFYSNFLGFLTASFLA